MVEAHTGGPETKQQKSSFNAAETARENRQAQQESQNHRPEMSYRSPEDKEDYHTAKQQQRSKDAPGHTGEQPTDGQTQHEASWTQRDEDLINDILGGATEEEINERKVRIKEDQEKEQQAKEKVHADLLKQYEKHHARLAAMTPEEREAWEKKMEERTPRHLTDEELTQVILKMHANVQAMQRKKAAWLHERDSRYDPMTGDLLEPDEHPLDPTAAYYFAGATRPRRFVPGDSPHLDKHKELQIDQEDVQPEGEYDERFVNRLLKAGFVEVEPTLADKASFEQTLWYRSLSPSEKIQFLRESMRQMTGNGSFYKETAGMKVGKEIANFIGILFDLLIACFAPAMEEEANHDEATQKAA